MPKTFRTIPYTPPLPASVHKYRSEKLLSFPVADPAAGLPPLRSYRTVRYGSVHFRARRGRVFYRCVFWGFEHFEGSRKCHFFRVFPFLIADMNNSRKSNMEMLNENESKFVIS